MVGCKATRSSPIGVNDENLLVALNAGVENNPLAVGRPARRAGVRSAEVSQSKWIGAIAVTQPEFQTARSVGNIDDSFAIRRVIRAIVLECGGDQPRGQIAQTC